MESLLCHPHTQKHIHAHAQTHCGFGAVSDAWISFTICDMQPQKKKQQQQATKRTSWFGLSCTESVNASVQFVRSSIAVAGSAARTCLVHLRVVGSGRVASTELGYWVKTAQQQQQINKNYESTANAILQTQHDETDADLTWHMA